MNNPERVPPTGMEPTEELSSEPFGALELVATDTDLDIREGRFQRWLALTAGLSSALSGIEVTYEHYRGGYSRRVMYTPVILSGALVAGGVSGFLSKRAARTILPAISILTLGDCVTGSMQQRMGRVGVTRYSASKVRRSRACNRSSRRTGWIRREIFWAENSFRPGIFRGKILLWL